MTGTSCDGLDVSCIQIHGKQWFPEWSATVAYPKKLRNAVLEFQQPGKLQSAHHFLDLHRQLGDWYGASLASLISRAPTAPDIIANHGQTVAHFPAPRGKGSTLQIGEPTRIAFATGLTVVSNFREGDMAAGGQGAPLAPLFHRMVAGRLGRVQRGIAIHNIGGVSNLTYLGPRKTILAFDTGPGNMWIDAAIERITHGRKQYDRGGRIALSSQADEAAVQRIMKHPYFKRPAPKSTGRDDFPFNFFSARCSARGPVLVATATRVTVESIVMAYRSAILSRRLPLHSIYLCGGGAKNQAILNGLREALTDVQILPLDGSSASHGIDGQWMEAQAFAMFGYLSLLGRALGGGWTGAKAFGPPGHIIPGRNWAAVLKKLHQADGREV